MNHIASPLPKEEILLQQAVPTEAAVVTSTLTDLVQIAITNTTSGALTITLTDGNNAVLGNFDEYSVDVSTPYVISFEYPLRCTEGLKWVASGSGLIADLHLYRHPEFSVVN